MEEGADQNENDHNLANENLELENDSINDAIQVNSSEELVKSPSIHNDETANEEKPIEQDTQPGAAKSAEEAEPTGEPEGDQEHEDKDDLDTTSGSLVLDDGEAPPEMNLLSREDSVMLESPGAGDPESPERETSSNALHEEEGREKEQPAEATVNEEVEEDVDDFEKYAQLYENLCAEREKLIQHGGQLQTKLAESSIFGKNTRGDDQLEKGRAVSYQQQQNYEMYLTHLGDLKLKEQVEEPKLQTQEKLQQVESEWQELMALKRHTAMTALGHHAHGKRAAHAVAEALAREQQSVEELVAARLANVKPKKKKKKCLPQTGANLPTCLLLLEQQKERQVLDEKYSEGLLKIRKNIASTTEVTVHIREELQWIQAENRSKCAQLAHWEGLVAQKRDLLMGAKKARNHLRSRTLELKQCCGMLGNVVLLRDFEDQMDACGQLEGDAGGLRRRHSETTLKCARWKKKLGRS